MNERDAYHEMRMNSEDAARALQEPSETRKDDSEGVVERRLQAEAAVTEALVASGMDQNEANDLVMELAAAELAADNADFDFMVDNTSRAFDAVTFGHISKPNTDWRAVEEQVHERIERAIAEALEEQEPSETAAARDEVLEAARYANGVLSELASDLPKDVRPTLRQMIPDASLTLDGAIAALDRLSEEEGRDA